MYIERTQICSSMGDRTRTHCFWHQTSNFKPNKAFIRFTKLFIKLTRTSFFRTSNKLQRGYLLVIEHTRTPYFWLLMIEHQTLNIVRPITSISLTIDKVKKGKNNYKCVMNDLMGPTQSLKMLLSPSVATKGKLIAF